MGKFIKAGRVVVLLQGRYTGKKGIVVKTFDDGSKSRPFGHCRPDGLLPRGGRRADWMRSIL